MFQRFTDGARRVVILAQEEARERADGRITAEHLLLGVCGAPTELVAALLAEAGLDRDTVHAELATARPDAEPGTDREALASLGIDLDEVRAHAESAFGAGALESTRAAGRRKGRGRHWGHIPFDAGAKKVLELALREALRLRDREIRTEHVLLGLLHEGTGPARALLEAHGMTLAGLRATLERRGDDGDGGDPGGVLAVV